MFILVIIEDFCNCCFFCQKKVEDQMELMNTILQITQSRSAVGAKE